jgi:hypothetical protein
MSCRDKISAWRNSIILLAISMTCLSCGAPGLFINIKEDEAQSLQAAKGTKLLVVRAYDNRKEASGKHLSYLGSLLIGNFNKYDVHVKDSVYFAQVLTEAVGKEIAKNGFQVTYFNRNCAVKPEIDYILKGSKITHIIFIEIAEFKCETMMQVDINWNLSIRLEDRNGNILAKNETHGEKEINANIIRPGKTSEEVIPIVFRECIDSLVNDAFIKEIKRITSIPASL